MSLTKVTVTGSLGLIGMACSRLFLEKGYDVIGIDNDMRRSFFGESASVVDGVDSLEDYKNYKHIFCDIRNSDISHYVEDSDLIIHCAAQPSHDWSYKDPMLDFDVNAVGTLNLLEAARTKSPDTTFIYLSTNKVYGDRPNSFNLIEDTTRYRQLDNLGVSEQMSIDTCVHSIFGVSKLSADLLVQEYGRNLGIKSAVLRCGCLTGSDHKGAELHGFLAYLAKCVKNGNPYTVYGYKGKQVRDNIHADDVASCINLIFERGDLYGEVFNIGGSFENNVSMLEAIKYFEDMFDNKLNYEISNKNRIGDHKWYITDMSKFKSYFPEWTPKYNYEKLMRCFL